MDNYRKANNRGNKLFLPTMRKDCHVLQVEPNDDGAFKPYNITHDDIT